MRFGENQLAPASPPSTATTPLVSDLLKLGSAAIQLITQQQVAKTNLELIKAGKQPIAVADVPGITPTISIQGGLDPQTRNMLLLGAAALGAFFLLGRKRRR